MRKVSTILSSITLTVLMLLNLAVPVSAQSIVDIEPISIHNPITIAPTMIHFSQGWIGIYVDSSSGRLDFVAWIDGQPSVSYITANITLSRLSDGKVLRTWNNLQSSNRWFEYGNSWHVMRGDTYIITANTTAHLTNGGTETKTFTGSQRY